MKDIFIYKDYSLLKEIKKIQAKVYEMNWHYSEEGKKAQKIYHMLKDLIESIEESLEVVIKE